jgi:Co/Zn/Cd efflux system component
MSPPPWLVTVTFLVEGVLIMMVACMGLVGNILSFVVLHSQKVQKTFHNLLILLNTFDMVSQNHLTP